MNNLTFTEIKEVLTSVIEKIKKTDPERGAYIERHIIVDDKNRNITYSGNQEIIKSVGNSVIQINSDDRDRSDVLNLS